MCFKSCSKKAFTVYSGVQTLLQNQKLVKEKEAIYNKKIKKVNAFFEDVKNGLRSIIENQQQNVLL